MTHYIITFLNDENGAVTVDWVVLTAAIIGLGLAVILSVEEGTLVLSNAISTAVATQPVGG